MTDRMKNSGRPRAASTLALVLLAASAAACGADDAPSAEAAAAAPARGMPAALVLSPEQVRHGGVRWGLPASTDMASTLELPARLAPDEDRTASLGAPAQGRVLSVAVQPGDRVVRGQVLVGLQSADASTARADYQKAAADLASRRAAATYARTARERAERLLAIKAVARQDVERAQADDELARSALAQAQAELDRARSAVARLGVSAADGSMSLRSTVTGVVLSRQAMPGTVVEPGAALVTVSDLGSLWLEIAASDRAAAVLRPGSRVRFAVPALPGDTFEASVKSVGGSLDPATRALPVRAVVANGHGRLRPEMFATAWVDVGERRGALRVPEDAVQLLDGKPTVFVARPDGKGGAHVTRRAVTTGATTGGQTLVFGGVGPGEHVVLAGAFAVKSEFARSQMPEG